LGVSVRVARSRELVARARRASRPLEEFTERTETDPQILRAYLVEIDLRGYAVEDRSRRWGGEGVDQARALLGDARRSPGAA
jgi:DNA-binding IclR family transcriptional regulator